MKIKNFIKYEIAQTPSAPNLMVAQERDIEDYIITNRQPTFSEVLFDFIDKKGVKDSEIYKKAGIDRRHFSKIKNVKDYQLGKKCVISLALALELEKKETDILLSAAGYSFSQNETFDLIIQFCLEKKIYDIYSVNLALDNFSIPPIAGC